MAWRASRTGFRKWVRSSKVTSFGVTSAEDAVDIRYSDYQEIRIQEHTERLEMGSIPRSMTIILQHDLVDQCKPGDHVTVTYVHLKRFFIHLYRGIVRLKWRSMPKDEKCEIEIVLDANYVHVANADRADALLDEKRKQEFRLFWKMHRNNPLAGQLEYALDNIH